ncbi:hypothetical protein [Nonomuraea sp. NPDC049480]|uniref:hypothetical protein n=1 Tax=Nonomuraea sp. NPDC049480 TaxID=3364353 RepID=UPI003796D18F
MDRSSFSAIYLLSAVIIVVLATGAVVLAGMEAVPETTKPVKRPSAMNRRLPAATPAADPVAPLKRRREAHLLVIGDRTLPGEVVALEAPDRTRIDDTNGAQLAATANHRVLRLALPSPALPGPSAGSGRPICPSTLTS